MTEVLKVCVVFLAVFVLCHTAAEPAKKQNHRKRRQSTTYYLDILVLVDYSLYRQWYDRSEASNPMSRDAVAQADIKRYYSLVINEVSDQYSRLKTSFRLRVRPIDFHIQRTQSQSSPWNGLQTGGSVDPNTVLNELSVWLAQSASNRQFDHAMLFTGCDLKTDLQSGHTTGQATVGTMCRGERSHSISVIEDRGAFQSMRTAVHELGHGLNASHDGIGNGCRAEDNYIMTAGFLNTTTESKQNPWFFSPCTRQEIQDYVDSIITDQDSRQCLENSLSQQSVPDVTGVVPGQLYNPDVQCRHLYGDLSSYCSGSNLSDICTYMPCAKALDCYVHFAATGTSCGNKKWCQAGACVSSPKAPELDDCPFGDRNGAVNGKTCAQAAATEPYVCYDDDIKEACCQSCQEIYTGVPGCPYGDRKTGCTRDICQRIEPNGYMYARSDCCGTCNFDSTSWTCADQREVDGMICAEAVRRQGLQGCYNESLAYLCCATCQAKRDLSLPQGCEYGDRLLVGCRSSSLDSNCDKVLCCKSCSQTDTGNIHRAGLSLLAAVLMCIIHNLLMNMPHVW